MEQSSPTLQQQKVTKGSQKSQQPKPLIGQSVPSQDLLQLHRTVDHASTSTLRRLVKNGSIKVTSKTMQALKDTPSITSLCEDCAKTKSIKKPLPKTSTPPLEKSDGKWHCDLKGQLITSGGGSRYVLQAAHARTGWDYSYFLPLKSDAPAALELLRVKAERDGHPIKILQLDNGGEFDSDEIDKWAREHEIKIQRTSPDSSQQNKMAERRIRLHSENSGASMLHSGLPSKYWPEAWRHSEYVRNRLPSSTRGFKSPYELYYGKPPDLSRFAPLGCEAYARTPDSITFAVNQLSRFAGKHREVHWKAMKRCLRYNQGHYQLWPVLHRREDVQALRLFRRRLGWRHGLKEVYYWILLYCCRRRCQLALSNSTLCSFIYCRIRAGSPYYYSQGSCLAIKIIPLLRHQARTSYHLRR